MFFLLKLFFSSLRSNTKMPSLPNLCNYDKPQIYQLQWWRLTNKWTNFWCQFFFRFSCFTRFFPWYTKLVMSFYCLCKEEQNNFSKTGTSSGDWTWDPRTSCVILLPSCLSSISCFSKMFSLNSLNQRLNIFVITVKGFKRSTSCVRDQNVTTVPAMHMWKR